MLGVDLQLASHWCSAKVQATSRDWPPRRPGSMCPVTEWSLENSGMPGVWIRCCRLAVATR